MQPSRRVDRTTRLCFARFMIFGRALVSFDRDTLKGTGKVLPSVHLYFLVPLVPFRNVPGYSMEGKIVSIILAAATLSRPESPDDSEQGFCCSNSWYIGS